jgi:hypothetical protein
VQERICQLISAGNYINTACRAAGIKEQTYLNWLKWGEEKKAGIYFEFFEAIKKAEAVAEARNVTIIQTAAKDSWQAAAWWLERKHPDDWGRKDQHKITAKESLSLDVSLNPKNKILDRLNNIASSLEQ